MPDFRVVICRSNPVSPDPRVTKIALSLSKSGYVVSILGWDRTGDQPEHQSINNISYYRLPIYANYGAGLGNLSALIRWQWGLLKWLVRHRSEFDLIHACDFDTLLPAILLKWVWKKKVVYDIFDFYADHLRSTPVWIKQVIQFVDKMCINWVDAIILTDDARWAQIVGAKPRNSAIIYNSPADIREAQPPDDSSRKAELSLVYIGLLQKERGIFEVLSVLQDHPEWHLDLAGFGGDQDQIYQKAVILPNVSWHGRISYDKALHLSNSADIIFATYDPVIKNHQYASPNKVFEAMMLAKPLIVALGTNIDQIVSKFECGLVVDYGDEGQLENAFKKLAVNPELRHKMGTHARQAYEQYFSWAEMEKRLNVLYADVVS